MIGNSTIDLLKKITESEYVPNVLYCYLNPDGSFLKFHGKVKSLRRRPEPVRGLQRAIFKKDSQSKPKIYLLTHIHRSGIEFPYRLHPKKVDDRARPSHMDIPTYETDVDAMMAAIKAEKEASRTEEGFDFNVVEYGFSEFIDLTNEAPCLINDDGLWLWPLVTFFGYAGFEYENFPKEIADLCKPLAGNVESIFSLTPAEQTDLRRKIEISAKKYLPSAPKGSDLRYVLSYIVKHEPKINTNTTYGKNLLAKYGFKYVPST